MYDGIRHVFDLAKYVTALRVDNGEEDMKITITVKPGRVEAVADNGWFNTYVVGRRDD